MVLVPKDQSLVNFFYCRILLYSASISKIRASGHPLSDRKLKLSKVYGVGTSSPCALKAREDIEILFMTAINRRRIVRTCSCSLVVNCNTWYPYKEIRD